MKVSYRMRAHPVEPMLAMVTSQDLIQLRRDRPDFFSVLTLARKERALAFVGNYQSRAHWP